MDNGLRLVFGSSGLAGSNVEGQPPNSPIAVAFSGLQRWASRLFLMLWPVKSEPSWNLIPARALIVHVVPSALPTIESARNG